MASLLIPRSRLLSSLAVLAGACALGAMPVNERLDRRATPSGVQVGDTPAHTFRASPWNAVGVRSLEDLRGRPVLVEFWGTRCPPCVGTAVPASLKLQETFADDLAVLFVESQGSTPETALSFALQQRWLGGHALWTSEAPFDSGTSSLPAFVLLGNDGRVLLSGNPITLHKEIERQVTEQIKLRNNPPPDTHPLVAPAWTEFARERYARAFESARAVQAVHAGDPAVLEVVAQSMAAFRRGLEARCARVALRIDQAWFDEAAEELDALSKGVKGLTEFEERVTVLRARLEDPTRAEEREAARQFGRLRARFLDAGGDAGLAAELTRFAERRSGSVLAARALDLVRLSRPVR